MGNGFSLKIGRKMPEPINQKDCFRGFSASAKLGFPCKLVCDDNDRFGGFSQGHRAPLHVHRATGAILSINKTVPAL